MKKVASIGHLVLVQLATKLDVDNRLALLVLELCHPLRFVPVHCHIQLLKHAEVGAWRRADQ